jgi:hypothetical protein
MPAGIRMDQLAKANSNAKYPRYRENKTKTGEITTTVMQAPGVAAIVLGFVGVVVSFARSLAHAVLAPSAWQS